MAMGSVTIDETFKEVLNGLKEMTILRDKSGKVIGRFLPGELTDEEVYALAPQLFDFEDIKRRKREESGKGRTTAEVLARLEALERPS